jgi:mannose-6-phosphate isomerase
MLSNKNNILKLQGKVQHYDWGGFDFIPGLLGLVNDKHHPFAEYWLGAHDKASSILQNGETLGHLLRQQPGLLGEKVRAQFGRLPYLLKILDVKNMLSIQVHPNKLSAQTGFEKENQSGIAVNAPNRNYKDDNHKPELMLALSDFWLLHGFQNPERLKSTIGLVPEFNFMIPVFEQSGYRGLYELLMTMDQEKVNETMQALLNRIIPLYQTGALQKSNPDFWAARAALAFNEPGKMDRGIFSIYLFNILHLKEGEAIFQDAGILHAYLEGQNVEIMANSDNVLRGGLTKKHIDVPELMKHVSFQEVEPAVIRGRKNNKYETVYETPAPDFELGKITLNKNETYQTTSLSTDIYFVFCGSLEVSDGGHALKLQRGESFVAFCDTKITLRALSDAILFRASVPVN